MTKRKMHLGSLRVRGRIALSLCLIATLATLLTLVVPHYRLAVDLEEANLERLGRATQATGMLVARLQEQMRERHRAMAQTPEFRANLETADVPTLDALAEMIVEREDSVDAVVFTNSRGANVATAGDATLKRILTEKSFPTPVSACGPLLPEFECDQVSGQGDFVLSVHQDRLVVGTSIPLFIHGRFIGRAAFMEIQGTSVLEEWSSLAGGTLSLLESSAPRGDFERVAVSAPPFELRVQASFDAEETALGRLQTTILTSGLFALLVAFAARRLDRVRPLPIAVQSQRRFVAPNGIVVIAQHVLRVADRAVRHRVVR